MTIMPSIYGDIHTTAPETLPKPEADKFAIGDQVRHKRFGPGRVLDLHAGNALVRFAGVGEKRISIDFLSAAS